MSSVYMCTDGQTEELHRDMNAPSNKEHYFQSDPSDVIAFVMRKINV
jgi:hypothetical protein